MASAPLSSSIDGHSSGSPPQQHRHKNHATAEPEHEASADAHESSKHIGGAVTEILVCSALIVLPMVAFSTTLLYLVFQYQVVDNGLSPEDVGSFDSMATTASSKVYFVEINAQYLTFIASWSSTVAPLLVGFIMTLASYPVAKSLLQSSRKSLPSELLTPYQLILTTGLLAGASYSHLWKWSNYITDWRKERALQSAPLIRAVVISIAALLLG